MATDLNALAAEIRSMTPADQLRLAAQLLDAHRPKLAYSVADRVVKTLGAALCLQENPPKGST